jgi:hypothetical protein
MNANREPLKNRNQTARRIKHLVEAFYTDLNFCFIVRNHRQIPLPKLTLQEFFNFVKNIPYRKDPKPLEIVARPYYIIKHRALGMDCKKKGLLICSFLRMKNYKYRAIGSSSRPDKQVHHIYFELYEPTEKKWKPVDATYNNYRLFEPKTQETYREVLK